MNKGMTFEDFVSVEDSEKLNRFNPNLWVKQNKIDGLNW
jgi:hypothetical protein